MRLEESWGLLAMKFDDNELYSIPSSVNGTQCSLHNLAKWKNGLAFKKINFSDEGVPVIKIAELNNGIGPTTAYTKEIFFRGRTSKTWRLAVFLVWKSADVN